MEKLLSIYPQNSELPDMSTQLKSNVIADYFQTQPVLRAWLFGSYARGYLGNKYLDEPFLPILFDTYRLLFPSGYRVFPISQWLLK